MSAIILEFPTSPTRFSARVEVREHWSRNGELCFWRVMAIDHNGAHLVDSFADPAEAEDFAEGFRRRYREIFAKDIARRRGARRVAAPWWIEEDHKAQASRDAPPDGWDDRGGAA